MSCNGNKRSCFEHNICSVKNSLPALTIDNPIFLRVHWKLCCCWRTNCGQDQDKCYLNCNLPGHGDTSGGRRMITRLAQSQTFEIKEILSEEVDFQTLLKHVSFEFHADTARPPMNIALWWLWMPSLSHFNNPQNFSLTFRIHLYDVILFPNKLVFVELIFDALSFLVIFQIIWFRYASLALYVNISQNFFSETLSKYLVDKYIYCISISPWSRGMLLGSLPTSPLPASSRVEISLPNSKPNVSWRTPLKSALLTPNDARKRFSPQLKQCITIRYYQTDLTLTTTHLLVQNSSPVSMCWCRCHECGCSSGRHQRWPEKRAAGVVETQTRHSGPGHGQAVAPRHCSR